MTKLRLAIVGAGPAGIYAADILLKAERKFDVSIDLFDQLPAPYGLVRYGVAPDHPRIKGIINALRNVIDHGDMRLFGNVHFGTDITLEDLKRHYNAVIFATGAVRDSALEIMKEVGEKHGIEIDLPVGCMIELPRAALTAGRIAEEAQFFSFGTNDLTQTTWGFSRDDVEGAFFAQYTANGVLSVSPFDTIDAQGVGRLVKIAVDEGKATRPELHLGVCGEHGGDPESIRFFLSVGLDYVSCSPFRVPVARLEAGRAAVETAGSDSR